MSQIQLDKLLLNVPALKADPAALKMVVAEVYNGQIQQLTGGQHQLQLPTASGPLQITLPASLPAQLQGQVKVQFQPAGQDQLQLTIQPTDNAATKITLTQQQTQQLLFQLTRQLNAASGPGTLQGNVATVAASQSQAGTTLNAQLTVNSYKNLKQFSLQIGGTTLPLTAGTNKALSQLLPATPPGTTLPVVLHIAPKGGAVILQLVPATGNARAATSASNDVSSSVKHSPDTVASRVPGTNTGQTTQLPLKPAEYQQLLQQLTRLVNQQQPGITVKQGAATLANGVNLPLPALGSNAGSYQIQMQLQANGQGQVVLHSSATNATSLTVSMQEINRPLQLTAASGSNSAPTLTPATANVTTLAPEQLQQAWRNLLPLLPDSPDPLAEQSDLPPQVQAILKIIKLSQPDGGKTLAPAQVVNQLASVLQFQPLQNNPSPQTAGGTLAVAIQLLLGHLQQKPTAPAPTANARLAQLVSQLDAPTASGLLRQLASHSSTLQQSQLGNIDSSNPQQQLLLQLPLHQNEQSVFTQLQIEQREADGKQKGEKQTLWQLTMKFDLQKYGSLLVVARLQQAELQLQFYTDESSTQQLAEKFLPLLKDRCNAQGLSVTKAECLLGKIPDTLVPRANSLVTIRV